MLFNQLCLVCFRRKEGRLPASEVIAEYIKLVRPSCTLDHHDLCNRCPLYVICNNRQWFFTIYKKFPKKSGWRVNKNGFSGRFSGKLPGATEVLKRQSCLPSRIDSNGIVFDFFKAIFDTSFRLSQPFFVKWNPICASSKCDSWTKFISPEFFLPLAQTVN